MDIPKTPMSRTLSSETVSVNRVSLFCFRNWVMLELGTQKALNFYSGRVLVN